MSDRHSSSSSNRKNSSSSRKNSSNKNNDNNENEVGSRRKSSQAACNTDDLVVGSVVGANVVANEGENDVFEDDQQQIEGNKLEAREVESGDDSEGSQNEGNNADDAVNEVAESPVDEEPEANEPSENAPDDEASESSFTSDGGFGGIDLFGEQQENEPEQGGEENNNENQEARIVENPPTPPNDDDKQKFKSYKTMMQNIYNAVPSVPQKVLQSLKYSFYNPNNFPDLAPDNPKAFLEEKCLSIAEEVFFYGLEKFKENPRGDFGKAFKDHLRNMITEAGDKLKEESGERMLAEIEEEVKEDADAWVTKMTETDPAQARTYYEAIKNKNMKDGVKRLDRNDVTGYEFVQLDNVFVKNENMKGQWKILKDKRLEHVKLQEAVSEALKKVSLIDFCKSSEGGRNVGQEKENWVDAFVALNASSKVVDILLEECFENLHGKFKWENPEAFTGEEVVKLNTFISTYGNLGENEASAKYPQAQIDNADEDKKKELKKKRQEEKDKHRNHATNNFIDGIPKLKKCFAFFKKEFPTWAEHDMHSMFHKIMVKKSNYPRWWDEKEGRYQLAMIAADNINEYGALASYDTPKASRFFRNWPGSVATLGCAGLKAINDLRLVRNKVAHASGYKLEGGDRQALFYTLQTVLMALSNARVKDRSKLREAVEEAKKTMCLARKGCFKVHMHLVLREHFCCVKENVEELQKQWNELEGPMRYLAGVNEEGRKKIYLDLVDLWERADKMSEFLRKLITDNSTSGEEQRRAIGKELLKATYKSSHELEKSMKQALNSVMFMSDIIPKVEELLEEWERMNIIGKSPLLSRNNEEVLYNLWIRANVIHKFLLRKAQIEGGNEDETWPIGKKALTAHKKLKIARDSILIASIKKVEVLQAQWDNLMINFNGTDDVEAMYVFWKRALATSEILRSVDEEYGQLMEQNLLSATQNLQQLQELMFVTIRLFEPVGQVAPLDNFYRQYSQEEDFDGTDVEALYSFWKRAKATSEILRKVRSDKRNELQELREDILIAIAARVGQAKVREQWDELNQLQEQQDEFD